MHIGLPVNYTLPFSDFSFLSHKIHDFRKEIVGNSMGVVIFSTTSVRSISHYMNKWARYDQKCILVFL